MSLIDKNTTTGLMFSPIPVEEMQTMFRRIVREELESVEKRKLEDKYLSVKDACQVFQPAIRRETLHNWTKKGLVQRYTINRRVYYKYSELMEAAKHLSKYKRVAAAA